MSISMYINQFRTNFSRRKSIKSVEVWAFNAGTVVSDVNSSTNIVTGSDSISGVTVPTSDGLRLSTNLENFDGNAAMTM